jgi:regulator of replication initiation timing
MSFMDAKDRRIAKLEKQLNAALEDNARLKAEIAALKKNSATSSKPPSSDIVKPPKPKKDKERRECSIQVVVSSCSCLV